MMANELLDMSTASEDPDPGERMVSVAVAKVLCNIDTLGLGRVQVSIPWLPGFEPWARVATMMGGMARGTFFIPQINDEVLVAFNQGDIREPYVIGSLWSTIDRPPALLPTDPINKRVIRTPLGHEIEFDDLLQTVTITSTTKQSVKLGPTGVEIVAGALPPPTRSKITLDVLGNITLESKVSIKLDAPVITITGKAVTVNGDATTTVKAGGLCSIKGAFINLN
jgi:phage baseplate assembly protein gpV